MENKRDWSIDFIRILSCAMVVLGHSAAEDWYLFRPDTFNWGVLNFIDTLCRPSIPLFVMISGYLFLRRKKFDYKKLWLSNIVHILIVYAVWVLFYAFVTPGLKRTLADPKAYLADITGLHPSFHLWYLRTLIYIYALIPLLWTLIHSMNEKLMRYFLILFMVFGILLPTLKDAFGLTSWIGRQIDLFGQMELMGYTGYFIFGYLLAEKIDSRRISDRALLITCLCSYILAAAGNQLISIKEGRGVEAFYSAFSLPVFIEAVCIFLLFTRRFSSAALSPKAAWWVRRLSESTLFIYLIHPFVIRRLEIYLEFRVTSINPLLGVPAMAIMVFIPSALIGMLIKRIPILNKIC